MSKSVHYLNKFKRQPCKAILRALVQFHTAFRDAPVGSIHVNPADFDEVEADKLPVVADPHVPEGEVVVEAGEKK